MGDVPFSEVTTSLPYSTKLVVGAFFRCTCMQWYVMLMEEK